MRDPKEIVINTGPLIAIVAATGHLDILRDLYSRVVVPFEVCAEISCGGEHGFAVTEFQDATWLTKLTTPARTGAFLSNSLDAGEAGVIQTALDSRIDTVCIDEAVGRRIARLNGLLLTGSVGILLRAKHLGHQIYIRECLDNMQRKGIWLGNAVRETAIREAGE